MEIKAETRTVFVVDGVEYPTRAAAQDAVRIKLLVDILDETGGTFYGFSKADAAAALVSQREKIIKILGGSLTC